MSQARVIAITLVSTCFHLVASQTVLGLEENASCLEGGVCLKLNDCPTVGDFRYTRPSICSFRSWEPVICCEPSSLAVEMCRRYDRMACSAAVPVFRSALNNSQIVGEELEKQDVEEDVGVAEDPEEEKNKNIVTGVLSWVKGLVRKVKNVVKPREGKNSKLEESNQTKVVGGVAARARELPFMALIGYGRPEAIEWNCGGSIISELYVLTAAHCALSGIGPARFVRVGELDKSTWADDARHQDIAIAQRIVHPNYTEPAVYNDIALLRLAYPLLFNWWVQPICLQVSSEISEDSATAAGWGRIHFVGPTSEQLMKVDIGLVEVEKCRTMLGRAGRFLPRGVEPRSMVCAGEPEGGKDACTGDSGGPLFVHKPGQCIKTQIGIVSFGRQCALPNTPGIYTRISYFIPWIERIVWPQRN